MCGVVCGGGLGFEGLKEWVPGLVHSFVHFKKVTLEARCCGSHL
jgi:hypothetical protein